jgi:hypothetical protein
MPLPRISRFEPRLALFLAAVVWARCAVSQTLAARVSLLWIAAAIVLVAMLVGFLVGFDADADRRLLGIVSGITSNPAIWSPTRCSCDRVDAATRPSSRRSRF